MRVSKKRGPSQRGTSTRFHAPRRRPGEDTDGDDGSKAKGSSEPTRTAARTYMQRGFSGYHRPKRPKRKGQYGVKTWTAEDELPGVTRPRGVEISQAQQKGQTAAPVVVKVKKSGGCHRSK